MYIIVTIRFFEEYKLWFYYCGIMAFDKMICGPLSLERELPAGHSGEEAKKSPQR
jgi:hypothetical protein